jgi:hypothetical protein
MTRARHEAAIRRLDTTFGDEFETALAAVVHSHRGLNFFTDEQIAEIRDAMIQKEWDRRRDRKDFLRHALAKAKAA